MNLFVTRIFKMIDVITILVFFCMLGYVSSIHQYHAHDRVAVVANTVGPYNNPTETYAYYSLPFCSGTGRQRRHKQDLGETLSGSRKVATPYELTFLDPIPWRSLCEEYLDANDIKEFKSAIESDYFFEMFIDDLPMWGYIGEVVHEEFLLGKSIQGARVYLYPHLHFTIGYNNDQIVTANVTTDAKRRIDITDSVGGQEVVFSFSLEWVHTPEIKYEDRMTRYHDSTFLPTSFEIHWLSVVNSFVLVILLAAFLTVIFMRILKKDFSRYMEVDEDELTEEETGWKMIHGDVFRAPPYINLFLCFHWCGCPNIRHRVDPSLRCANRGFQGHQTRRAVDSYDPHLRSLCSVRWTHLRSHFQAVEREELGLECRAHSDHAPCTSWHRLCMGQHHRLEPRIHCCYTRYYHWTNACHSLVRPLSTDCCWRYCWQKYHSRIQGTLPHQ